MKTENKIKFGILVNLGTVNKHWLNPNDPLKREYFSKIDTFNYLYPFSEDTIFEDFDSECDDFKGWADQINSTDSGLGFSTGFYFVCYITDREGKPVEIRKIKELHY